MSTWNETEVKKLKHNPMQRKEVEGEALKTNLLDIDGIVLPEDIGTLPTSYDWRDYGAINPIFD